MDSHFHAPMIDKTKQKKLLREFSSSHRNTKMTYLIYEKVCNYASIR